MVHLKNTLLFLVLSIFIISCNNSTKPAKEMDTFDDIEVDEKVAEAVDFPLPSAVEIVDLLNKTGAGYIFDATNPPENVDNYISYKQKAINLGIYGADLTYTITYGKKNETAAYLDNFVLLIEDLEISNLDQDFFIKVQNNLDNKDSLMIIVKKAIYDTHMHLKETNKDEIALYALVGSWAESVYLVGSTLKFSENKKPLYELILNHKDDLSEIIALIKPHKNTEEFKELYASLEEINNVFSKMEGKSSDSKHAENLKGLILDFRNTLI